MPFTGRDTISKIEGFITSNGFIREASSGAYEFKYRDGNLNIEMEGIIIEYFLLHF